MVGARIYALPLPLSLALAMGTLDDFYQNRWHYLTPQQASQFHATLPEVKQAVETREAELLRRAMRRQRSAFLKAVLEVR